MLQLRLAQKLREDKALASVGHESSDAGGRIPESEFRSQERPQTKGVHSEFWLLTP